jgi:hypothetical protein
MNRFIDPTLRDAIVVELTKTATLNGGQPVDDLHAVPIIGTIDLGELIAVVSEDAARVSRVHHVKATKLDTPVRPTLGELAMEFTRRAAEARA